MYDMFLNSVKSFMSRKVCWSDTHRRSIDENQNDLTERYKKIVKDIIDSIATILYENIESFYEWNDENIWIRYDIKVSENIPKKSHISNLSLDSKKIIEWSITKKLEQIFSSSFDFNTHIETTCKWKHTALNNMFNKDDPVFFFEKEFIESFQEYKFPKQNKYWLQFVWNNGFFQKFYELCAMKKTTNQKVLNTRNFSHDDSFINLQVVILEWEKFLMSKPS